MRLNDIRIRTRIGAGFLLLVTLTLLLGLLSLMQLADVARTTERIATRHLPRVELMSELRDMLNEIRRSEARHLLSSERKEMKSLEAHMAQVRERLKAFDEKAAPLLDKDEDRERLKTIARHRQAWFAASDQMQPASRAGKQDDATNIYNGESAVAFNAALAEAEKLRAASSKEAADAWEDANAIYREARYVLLGCIVFLVALAIVMALLIARSIARPIEEAARAASQIASGDMTVSLQVRGRDEASQLLSSLDAMRLRLSDLVAAVRHSSHRLAEASVEMARDNEDLSTRTALQASALQQTSASMEQLGTTVRQNTDHAHQGNELAVTASSVAERGRDAVRQVVSTMDGIQQSSRQIEDIIGIIDGIAFQTNILALNAAVEAARAGEDGRGFSVVAGEVRSLAGRSAKAAQEIKGLIRTSGERVRTGTKLVDEAGNTMMEVVAAIQRVSEIMGAISMASREQLEGVSQVGSAVTHMDQATQQNAHLVEAIAAAAAGLKTQAAELVQTVAVFRVQGDAARTDSGIATAALSAAEPA